MELNKKMHSTTVVLPNMLDYCCTGWSMTDDSTVLQGTILLWTWPLADILTGALRPLQYDSLFPITMGWTKHVGRRFIIHYSLSQSLYVKWLQSVITTKGSHTLIIAQLKHVQQNNSGSCQMNQWLEWWTGPECSGLCTKIQTCWENMAVWIHRILRNHTAMYSQHI